MSAGWVGVSVASEVAGLAEGAAAVLAHEGLLAGVDALVGDEGVGAGEGRPAHVARVLPHRSPGTRLRLPIPSLVPGRAQRRHSQRQQRSLSAATLQHHSLIYC